MIRKWMFGVATAAMAGLVVGCDSGTNTQSTADKSEKRAADTKAQMEERLKGMADKGKEMAKDGMEKGKEALKEGAKKFDEALRSETLKPVAEKLDAIKGKLGSLSGDASVKAKSAFEDLTKLVEEFKKAPLEKLSDLVDPLKAKLAEVLKLVGITS